jgi:hypothetical protein
MHPNDIKLAALAGLVTLTLCVLPHAARAAEQHITCPAAVDARQVRVDAPAGWTGLFGPVGTLQLQGVQAIFVVGSLRDAAWGELKDPPTTTKGDAVIANYELPPATDKYVVCNYGERVYQELKLPAATKECDVVYRPDQKAANGRKANYAVADVICR